MSRMPGAAWVPLPRFSTGRMSAHNIVCIHTMVGSLMGTDAYFRSITSGVNSHYGTGGVGERIRQWGDTVFRSGANLDGNGEVISVENADMGPGFPAWDTSNPAAVPPFTDQQAEDIAQILAWECSVKAHANCPPTWACHREGIPLALIPDALPGRRGIGYHRQGVPGFMVPGAVKWSSSTGKVCPTDRRVGQLPSIIARAAQIQAGTTSEEDDTVKYLALRSDTNRGGNGAVFLAAPGQWTGVTSGDYFKLLKGRGVCGEWVDCSPAELDYFRSVYLESELNDEEIKAAVDALAKQLKPSS